MRQVVPLQICGWSLAEFERATSVLGWELQGPKEVAGRVMLRFGARQWPWGGYATAVSDASEPDRVRGVDGHVVDLLVDDVPTAAARVRPAW